jgi:hypothetical protein
MAQVIKCDQHEAETAAFIVTMVEMAEVGAFCMHCFGDFCVMYLREMDPGKLAKPPAGRKLKSTAEPAPAVADD